MLGRRREGEAAALLFSNDDSCGVTLTPREGGAAYKIQLKSIINQVLGSLFTDLWFDFLPQLYLFFIRKKWLRRKIYCNDLFPFTLTITRQ